MSAEYDSGMQIWLKWISLHCSATATLDGANLTAGKLAIYIHGFEVPSDL